jgi:hypothetical protein
LTKWGERKKRTKEKIEITQEKTREVKQCNGNLGNCYFQGNPVKTLASILLMNSMFGDYKTKIFPTMKCSFPRPKVWFDMVSLKLARVKS